MKAAWMAWGAMISACAGGASAQPAAPDMNELRGRLQERLSAWREEKGAPGITAAFVLPDGSPAAAAAGVSNMTDSRPMEPMDRMLAGSVGKTFVAAVMLQLVEEGKADLDGKVASWFGDEEWYAGVPSSADLTLRMLMNHTSGIPEHVQVPEFLEAIASDPRRAWRPEELVSYVVGAEARFPAGEGWSYADTNYILVGMIIEKITGRAYYEELRVRVLEPCLLAATTPSDRPDLPGLISGYTAPGGPFPVPAEVASAGRYALNPQFEWTGGGVVSTSLDLARWAHALYGGDVLKEETKALMLEGVPAKTGPGDKYGLGVQIWKTAHGEAYGHSGWFPGYVSRTVYYPSLKIAVAVQVNTDVGAAGMGLGALMDEIAGAVAPAPEPVLEPSR